MRTHKTATGNTGRKKYSDQAGQKRYDQHQERLEKNPKALV